MNKPARTSGEVHPNTVAAMNAYVVVTVAGRVIASTAKALMLDETSGGRTYYIPRKDVDMALLKRSAHVTHDPDKGDCVYYSIPAGGVRSRRCSVELRNALPGHSRDQGLSCLRCEPRRCDRGVAGGLSRVHAR